MEKSANDRIIGKIDAGGIPLPQFGRITRNKRYSCGQTGHLAYHGCLLSEQSVESDGDMPGEWAGIYDGYPRKIGWSCVEEDIWRAYRQGVYSTEESS
jgi:hypothetical protein